MRIQELNGKKVCILGFGKEGKAVLRALETYAPKADVTIADASDQWHARPEPSRREVHCKVQVGPGYLDHLDRFDVIIKSPGIPPKPELDAVKGKIISGTQIFL